MNELKEIRSKLIAEQKELSLKVEKLHAFLHSEKCDNLDREIKYLLVEQYGYMKNYLRILNKRIALINNQLKSKSK